MSSEIPVESDHAEDRAVSRPYGCTALEVGNLKLIPEKTLTEYSESEYERAVLGTDMPLPFQ